MQELEDLINPEGRANVRNLISDRPGRSFDSRGRGRHAMDPEVDAVREHAERFAKQVADRVEQGRKEGAFDELVLAAAPEFLGMLRQYLSDTTLRQVRATVDKNLVLMDEPEIRARLP